MPKGDADELRADLDDGYTKVANLLMEALCVAPLTGTEYAVVMFVMRQTYGWAKNQVRTSGKYTVVSAEEIAYSTYNAKSTVHKAIRQLVNDHVLTSELVAPGNIFAYGMNPDIKQWGDGSPEWKQAKTRLKEAREKDTYNRKRTDLYPKLDTGLTKNGQTSIQKRTDPQALSPTGTGADEALTDSITDNNTDNNADGEFAETVNIGMVLQDNATLTATFNNLQPSWGLRKCQRFTLDTAAAIADPEEVEITRAAVNEWLNTDGMRPKSTDRSAADWLRRCKAILWDHAKHGTPINPRADPVLAAHVAKEGPCPADAMAAMIWNRKLEDARGEVRQTA